MAHLNAPLCARGARQLAHNNSSIHCKSISSHSQRYCFSAVWASPSSGTWDFRGAQQRRPPVSATCGFAGVFTCTLVGSCHAMSRLTDNTLFFWLQILYASSLVNVEFLKHLSNRLFMQVTSILDAHFNLPNSLNHLVARCQPQITLEA